MNKNSNTILFDSVIFGPVTSRRLGTSLGINLLPLHSKICNFNCVYCECGWTDLRANPVSTFHDKQVVLYALESKLKAFKKENRQIHSITFAGNGEPTLHPDFPEIVTGVISLRNKYFPETKVSVLSNSLLLGNPEIFQALQKVDNPILKLDAGTERMFQLIDQPLNRKTLDWVVSQLEKFKGNVIIQTMFLRGRLNDIVIDNTTEFEVAQWLQCMIRINPKMVMLYSLDRATEAKDLEKVENLELQRIADQLQSLGIASMVS